MLTPMAMKMVLHIYTSGADFDVPKSETRDRMLQELAADGLIEGDGINKSGWRMTEKGDAFVTLALDTPIPVQVWACPRTNDVIVNRSRI